MFRSRILCVIALLMIVGVGGCKSAGSRPAAGCSTCGG
jgi:hypothetical protein